jgi:heme exporter protein C
MLQLKQFWRGYLMRTLAKLALGLWMIGVIMAAFLYAPPVIGLGESARIIFWHVPAAWVAVLAFLVSMIQGVRYLRSRNLDLDLRASVAAELGFAFCLLATITGSIWAQVAWGSFWNWDPRETSIFVLLLIYGAYFALRQAIDEDERRARLAAVYGIIAFITVPFLVFAIPRVYFTLHPDPVLNPRLQLNMDARMFQVFIASLIGFTGLFVWIYHLQVTLGRAWERVQASLAARASAQELGG